ncbi:hypothetical protein, partial [Aliarcobacter butzleri]
EKAQKDNQTVLNMVDNQFKPLKDRIQSISNSTTTTNENYLTIPQLLTAGILTDTEIIDFEKTNATGTFQLKDNF